MNILLKVTRAFSSDQGPTFRKLFSSLSKNESLTINLGANRGKVLEFFQYIIKKSPKFDSLKLQRKFQQKISIWIHSLIQLKLIME